MWLVVVAKVLDVHTGSNGRFFWQACRTPTTARAHRCDVVPPAYSTHIRVVLYFSHQDFKNSIPLPDWERTSVTHKGLEKRCVLSESSSCRAAYCIT